MGTPVSVGGIQWEAEQRAAGGPARQAVESSEAPPTSKGAAVVKKLTNDNVQSVTLPGGTRMCLVTVRGGDVGFTENGTDPTTTDAAFLPQGFYDPRFEICTNANIKLIRLASDEQPTVTFLPRAHDGT
jgi:hypothetical protein